MRIVALAFAFALVGCSDAAEDAERELAIVKNSNGSAAEICEASRRVANAHLKAGNETAYREARVRANIECTAGVDMTAQPDDLAP